MEFYYRLEAELYAIPQLPYFLPERKPRIKCFYYFATVYLLTEDHPFCAHVQATASIYDDVIKPSNLTFELHLLLEMLWFW